MGSRIRPFLRDAGPFFEWPPVFSLGLPCVRADIVVYLIRKYLDGIQLEVTINRLVDRLAGLSPADLDPLLYLGQRT